MDLLVPVNRRDRDQLTIREDVSGGIKASPILLSVSVTHLNARVHS